MPSSDHSGDHDIIFIEDYEITMSIGIYDREKAEKQRVMVSVEACTLPNAAHKNDSIEHALSYEVFVEAIQSLSTAKHYDLVETFAEELSTHIKAKSSGIQSLIITVRKPDIFAVAKSAGIKISRSF
jgi:dihydroneopterin aldolase